jgi:hemin uptake protein HemP
MHVVTLPLSSTEQTPRAASSAPHAHSLPAQRQFDSRSLFGDAREVRIEHYGQEYRLRQTRNGKLILTK